MISVFAIAALGSVTGWAFPSNGEPSTTQGDHVATLPTSLKLFSPIMEPSTNYRLTEFSSDGRTGVRLTKSESKPSLETFATVIPSRDGKNYELSVPQHWLDNKPQRESVPDKVLVAALLHCEQRWQFEGTGWWISWESSTVFFRTYSSWVPEDFADESMAKGDYVVRLHRMPVSPGLGISVVVDRAGQVKRTIFGV